MINAKKLIELARKRQKHAAIKRKRITLPMDNVDEDSCSTSSVVEKCHFLVYSTDHRRFVLPLEYLKKHIVRELFRLAEEEFGIPSSRPLTVPSNAAFMEYVISLIKMHLTREVEEAVITSLASSQCLLSSLLHQESRN